MTVYNEMLAEEGTRRKRQRLSETSDITTLLLRFVVNERLPVSILESVYLNDLVEGMLILCSLVYGVQNGLHPYKCCCSLCVYELLG